MRSVPACMCQNKSSNNCDHWEKKCTSKWSRNWNWKKSLAYCGIEFAAEVVNHCLSTSFWQECTTAVHRLLPTPRAVMNEWKQLSFSNHHSRAPRWRAFNFVLRCVLGMPGNWIKKKNLYAKHIDFWKRKSVHQLDSNPRPPECKSVALPIAVVFDGVFSTSSSSTRCRTQSDHCITRSDKLEVGRWWV